MTEKMSVIPVPPRQVHDHVDGLFGHNPRDNKFIPYADRVYRFGTIPRISYPTDGCFETHPLVCSQT